MRICRVRMKCLRSAARSASVGIRVSRCPLRRLQVKQSPKRSPRCEALGFAPTMRLTVTRLLVPSGMVSRGTLKQAKIGPQDWPDQRQLVIIGFVSEPLISPDFQQPKNNLEQLAQQVALAKTAVAVL